MMRRLIAIGALLWPGFCPAEDVITVSWLPTAGYVGNDLVYTGLLDKFRAAHPGVTVQDFKLMALPDQFSDASTAMGVAAAAGPDVLALPLSRLGDYIREGLIQPVDDLYDSYATPEREWPALREALRIDGKIWTACAGVHVPVLVVSRQAMEKAHVGEAALPRNWDQLAELAAKLTTKDTAGFGLPRDALMTGLWTALAREAGDDPGGRVGADGHREYRLTSPGSVAATEKLKMLGAAIRAAGGRVRFAEDSAHLDIALSKGEIGMALMDSAGLFAPIDPEESSEVEPIRSHDPYMLPFPGALSTTPLVWATKVDAWVMPSSITNPARRRLVWDYMMTVSPLNPDFDTGAFANLAMPDAIPDVGALVRHPDHVLPETMRPMWLSTFRLLLPIARPQPPYAEHAWLGGPLVGALEKLVMEGGSTADALAGVQRQYDTEVRNAGRRGSGGWRALAYLVLAGMAALLAASLAYLVRMLIDEIRVVRGLPSARLSQRAVMMLLALFAPGLLLSILFAAYPLANGLRMSLSRHVLNHGGTFAGLGNFVDVVLDPAAQHAVVATLGYMAWSFLLSFIGPLVLAIVLSGFRRLQAVARLLFFIPAAANAVVIALLWRQMYAPAGAVNLVAGFLGFAPRDWLASPHTALFAVCLAQAWAGLGINGLVYLAGLSTIPESLYEEAEMSGADMGERWSMILWPHLKPLMGISFVGWLLATARTSEQVLLLTAGGPDRATHVIGLEIFKQAYVDIHFGYAMAEVWLLISLILVLAIYQMRAIREGQTRVAF